MRIGFVSDEISSDITEAITTGVSWGIRDYELRMVGKNRVPDIPRSQVRQILTLRDRHDLRITALSPGLFKGSLGNEALLRQELNSALPKSLDLAREMGAPLVIVFGLRRSPGDCSDDEERVIDLFHEVAAMADHQGLRVAIENEPGFWCDSGANTARLLARVNSPALGANWDPCNALGSSEIPFPDGYESIKPWIANLHIKDTVKGALVECVPVGEGVLDWPGQLQAVALDQLVKQVTIETHCLPLVERSRQNLQTVRQILDNLE